MVQFNVFARFILFSFLLSSVYVTRIKQWHYQYHAFICFSHFRQWFMRGEQRAPLCRWTCVQKINVICLKKRTPVPNAMRVAYSIDNVAYSRVVPTFWMALWY